VGHPMSNRSKAFLSVSAICKCHGAVIEPTFFIEESRLLRHFFCLFISFVFYQFE
jgi:hypothetical protein